MGLIILWSLWIHSHIFNPLLPSVPYMARLTNVLILILEGITKKNRVATVGEKSLNFLGYVPKNDEKIQTIKEEIMYTNKKYIFILPIHLYCHYIYIANKFLSFIQIFWCLFDFFVLYAINAFTIR